MQRILAIAVLVIGASYLMAANPPSSSPDNAAANPAAAGQPAGPPPGPQNPMLENASPGSDGLLSEALGWEKYRQKTGVSIYFYMQSGISTNNNIKKGDPGYIYADEGNEGNGAIPNNANGPVATPSDADEITFEQIEMNIEKTVAGNMVIGATPTPAPMSKKFDWGFDADILYGRQVNGCRMTGFDHDWAMNPSAQLDTYNRYNWLCMPNAYFDLYFPILKGVAIRVGRQADQEMTDEIPPMFFFAPNDFYSHTYGFYRINQVLGGRVTATIMHSHKNGFLMGEFMVDANQKQAAHTLNGSVNYGYALRYRTPHMDTWVDYTGRFGPDEVKISCPDGLASCKVPEKALWVSDQLNAQHLFSTGHQMMFENALQVMHEFRPKWKVEALIQFGKQFGDGAATTIETFTAGGLSYGLCEYVSYEYSATLTIPACKNHFTGASYLSYEGRVHYEFNKKLNATFRIEQFRNPNAYFGQPMFAALNYPSYTGLSANASTGCWSYSESTCYDGPPIWGAAKGAFNDITGGINYNPVKWMRIRPEIRYDWQSGNYGIPLFGQNNLILYTDSATTSNGFFTNNTESSQVTAAVDTVFYF